LRDLGEEKRSEEEERVWVWRDLGTFLERRRAQEVFGR
jgi:hypothetical protein